MITLIALLDRPSVHSLAIIPVVLKTIDGSLIVTGVNKRPIAINQDYLDLLIKNGHVLCLPNPIVFESFIDFHIVAGWLGSFFEEKCIMLQGPEIAIKTTNLFVNDKGEKIAKFWLDTPDKIMKVIEQWVKKAAHKAIKNGLASLADLMIWALPDHEYTRAALLSTRSTQKERQRKLEWFARLDKNAGREIKIVDLEKQLLMIEKRIKS